MLGTCSKSINFSMEVDTILKWECEFPIDLTSRLCKLPKTNLFGLAHDSIHFKL